MLKPHLSWTFNKDFSSSSPHVWGTEGQLWFSKYIFVNTSQACKLKVTNLKKHLSRY